MCFRYAKDQLWLELHTIHHNQQKKVLAVRQKLRGTAALYYLLV